MTTFRSALASWGLEVDIKAFSEENFNPTCTSEQCTHKPAASAEDVLDFEVDSLSFHCDLLSLPGLMFGPPYAAVYRLHNVAAYILRLEKSLELDLIAGSAFGLELLDGMEAIPLLGLGQAKTFEEFAVGIIRKRLNADMNKTFEDFKKFCEINDASKAYDPNEPLVYVRLAGVVGFPVLVPWLAIGVLYGCELGTDWNSILKVPSWAIRKSGPISPSDTRYIWASFPTGRAYLDSPLLLGTMPVEEQVPALPGDDKAMFETLKVLSKEMKLADAVHAARTLK